MVFYFQGRRDANSPWHVPSENSVPLLAPRVEGDTLTFEVRHHKGPTCPELKSDYEVSHEPCWAK